MTYRCPIDGHELASGQPCPDHGIAYSDPGADKPERVVARMSPLSTRSSSSSSSAPAKRKRGK